MLCGSIAGRPGRFGVAMHNAAFRALGVDAVYVAFGTEDTAGAVAAMRTLGIRGFGVTMPHKQRIIEHLDDIDAEAQEIGAVNTVINDGGRLRGCNVDWLGALDAFAEAGFDCQARRAAVIGAGGGARSIAYALVRAGASVTVFNRTTATGHALANAFGVDFGGPPAALADARPFDLLAHATAVGFHAPDETLVPAGLLRNGMVVFDAVPYPIETRLLREAKAAGCRTIPGVRMQLHQAARQFEYYTGQTPSLVVMEQALRDALSQPPDK